MGHAGRREQRIFPPVLVVVPGLCEPGCFTLCCHCCVVFRHAGRQGSLPFFVPCRYRSRSAPVLRLRAVLRMAAGHVHRLCQPRRALGQFLRGGLRWQWRHPRRQLTRQLPCHVVCVAHHGLSPRPMLLWLTPCVACLHRCKRALVCTRVRWLFAPLQRLLPAWWPERRRLFPIHGLLLRVKGWRMRAGL